MKRLNKLVASIGLVAVLAVGASNVFAKSGDSRLRIITGQIVSIDRNARTILVRDAGTGQSFSVQIPEGSLVRTMSLSGAPLTFEQLISGMVVRDMTVK